MRRSKLPPISFEPDSDCQKFRVFWASLDSLGRLEWCRQKGVMLQTIYNYIHRSGGAKSTHIAEDNVTAEPWVTPSPKQEEPAIVNLPPIKLREYKPRKARRGDEEIALVHAGDGHAGKITRSFDEDVYMQRMDTMFDSIMAIVTLHRNMYPINICHIVDTGDNIQGENPHQGSKVGTIRLGARDQTVKLAYPAWVKLIGSLRQEFAEVIFDGWGGNHGYEKLAPETSREDFRLYDLLQSYFQGKKGITINIHEDFGSVIDICGFRFFCAHFDGIPCQQGIPLFGIDKALKAWYMQFGGFNYALGGHFHKWHYDEVSSRLEYYMVSTLVSDDDWALKKLKISSSPSQNIFGVHPTMGMTWKYKLIIDRKFLMEKLPNVYGGREI